MFFWGLRKKKQQERKTSQKKNGKSAFASQKSQPGFLKRATLFSLRHGGFSLFSTRIISFMHSPPLLLFLWTRLRACFARIRMKRRSPRLPLRSRKERSLKNSSR